MPLVYQKHILRSDLRANPDRLYVFGDNLQRYGLRGQAAEMRGEPNAVGIPTKKKPRLSSDAFFNNSDEDQQLFFVQAHGDVHRLIFAHEAGKTIVWPEDGVGTGLAQLQRRAPTIWNMIEELRLALEDKDI